jgi:hypothetical protein
MQTLSYQVFIPDIGANVTVNNEEYFVENYDSSDKYIDRLVIKNKLTKEAMCLVTVNGKWQIETTQEDQISINEDAISTLKDLEIQPEIGDKGSFIHAEHKLGTHKRTGEVTRYDFEVIGIIDIDSKIVIDFGIDFPRELYPQDLKLAPGRKTRALRKQTNKLPRIKANNFSDIENLGLDLSNPGLRIVTKRKLGLWLFKGYPRLYAGDEIQFEPSFQNDEQYSAEEKTDTPTIYKTEQSVPKPRSPPSKVIPKLSTKTR